MFIGACANWHYVFFSLGNGLLSYRRQVSTHIPIILLCVRWFSTVWLQHICNPTDNGADIWSFARSWGAKTVVSLWLSDIYQGNNVPADGLLFDGAETVPDSALNNHQWWSPENSFTRNAVTSMTCVRIPGTKELTHWDRDKMAAFRKLHIMKIYEVRLIFHWIFVPKYSIIGWDNGSAPTMRQAIIWTNDGKFNDEYMRHSASMS